MGIRVRNWMLQKWLVTYNILKALILYRTCRAHETRTRALTSWYSPSRSTQPHWPRGTHLLSLRTKPPLHWQPSTQVDGGKWQTSGKRSEQVGGQGGVHSEKWLFAGQGIAAGRDNKMMSSTKLCRRPRSRQSDYYLRQKVLFLQLMVTPALWHAWAYASTLSQSVESMPSYSHMSYTQVSRKTLGSTRAWQGLKRSDMMMSVHLAVYCCSSLSVQSGWMSGRLSGWQLERKAKNYLDQLYGCCHPDKTWVFRHRTVGTGCDILGTYKVLFLKMLKMIPHNLLEVNTQLLRVMSTAHEVAVCCEVCTIFAV